MLFGTLFISSSLLSTTFAICCLPYNARTSTGNPDPKQCPINPEGQRTLWTCCYRPDLNPAQCTNDYKYRYNLKHGFDPKRSKIGPNDCHVDSTTGQEDGIWVCIDNPKSD